MVREAIMRQIVRNMLLSVLSIVVITTAGAQYSKVASGNKIMIAAHPLAARAGMEIYKKGGNVVDVAVAVAYALGVVEPHGSGIGGEGMMLIYDSKEGRSTVIDFKAISPASASHQKLDLRRKSDWARSVKGASIPGAVAGLEFARERFGRLDRKSVLQPAVNFALHGYEVDSTLALNLESYRRILERDSSAKLLYYPEGRTPNVGRVLENPDYGKTLQLIQSQGPDAFYKGAIADLIVKHSETKGGFITKDDLLAYKPIVREALVGHYRGYEIITTPPPCGGMLLIETLNILKYFNLAEAKRRNEYNLHLFAETFKLVLKDEATHNGDPEFNTIPIAKVVSDQYAFQRFLQIDLAHSAHPAQVNAGSTEDKNTTHLSVMDIDGNAVSLTITLSSLFGTGQIVQGAGFMLNNEMQNFNDNDTHPNSLKPHKRVVTSLVPTIVAKNGKPMYVLGTPGGDLIISTIAQVIVNLVDFDMTLQDAVFAPRMFSIFTQRELETESRFSQGAFELLERFGHDVKQLGDYRAYFGSVQAIKLDSDARRLTGCSDPRRSGAAVGE